MGSYINAKYIPSSHKWDRVYLATFKNCYFAVRITKMSGEKTKLGSGHLYKKGVFNYTARTKAPHSTRKLAKEINCDAFCPT